MSQGRGKILVIRGGAIGDFILTLPVFAALRRHLPGTQLEVLGYPHIAQLALAGRLVEQVRSIESRPLAGFFARDGALDQSLADYFAGFAVIVSYLYDPDGIFRANVARCSKAQFIAGPHRPDEKLNLHATEVLLKPLERLAIFDSDPVPRLTIGQASLLTFEPGAQDRPAQNRPEAGPADWQLDSLEACPTLALHPGSGSEKKNWPEEHWMRLGEHLQATTGWDFLLVGGEAERGRLRRLSAAGHPGRVKLAEGLPLAQLACRLQTCRGFIGHDSGISHLAAALGLPALVLWGATNETTWRPRGDRVTVLRSPEGLQGLSVERVVEQVARVFAR